ncbi:erythromycin esterase family protein [Streptomyces yaizuensis]|uniref:Erythromycin esterase family protein n=1 Tax=Streptomyces yaizuensis TaxID=2989713 RepID=A0ABQ5P0Q8_9ACTN|nr:erythromycin esterase family protein [Streptomyces sp. YSPA8]GLF96194.1 erythromycin esterase family protein [Streptomyces sp. YSPA8]
MRFPTRTRTRLRLLLLPALALGTLLTPHVTGAATAPAAASTTSSTALSTTLSAADPVPALARAAHPLTDLRPLERMVGGASVVGVGEAAHGSGDFFRSKQRIFEHLVERKGFTTFALEANWSAGVRLNDYVLHGRGDVQRIMREEFQNSYALWNNREYLDLLRWMRQHNERHPHHPVRFMGNDMGYAGPELFDAVTRYVAEHHPALLAEVRERYRPWRPTGSVDATMKRLLTLPMAERQRMRGDLARVAELLGRRDPAPDREREREREREQERHAWTLQHARAIAQVGEMYTYNYFVPAQAAKMMRYRDRIMAENTVWWQRHTGQKVLLSAHNGHVGYETPDRSRYPRLQGAFIRDMIGDRYANVGFTFGRGSFNALDTADPAEPMREFSVAGPAPGGSEETLERVADHDYYLDLRTAPAVAQRWLNRHRPVWSIGNSWPEQARPQRLATGYDVLVHLRRVTASELLPGAAGR